MEPDSIYDNQITIKMEGSEDEPISVSSKADQILVFEDLNRQDIEAIEEDDPKGPICFAESTLWLELLRILPDNAKIYMDSNGKTVIEFTPQNIG